MNSRCKDEEKYIDRTQDETTAKQSEYDLLGMTCEFDDEELQENNALGQQSPSSIGLLGESLNLEANYSEETNELTVTSYQGSQHEDINISKGESAQIVREFDEGEPQNNITSSQETFSTFGSSVQPIYAPQHDIEGINENEYISSEGNALDENWLETKRDVFANACQENTASHGQQTRPTFQSYSQANDSGINELGDVNTSNFISTCTQGNEQIALGNYESALESYKVSLAIARAIYGEEHEKTAKIFFQMGLAHFYLQRYDASISLFEKLQESTKKIDNKPQILSAWCYDFIGMAKYLTMRNQDALLSFKRARDIKLVHEKDGGNELKKSIDFSYAIIGKIRFEQEIHSEDALQEHEELLQRRLTEYGTNHEKTADIYLQAGKTLRRIRKSSKRAENEENSIEYLEEAIHIRKELGSEYLHANTAECYYERAMIEAGRGNYDDALELLQCSLYVRQKVYGEQHAWVAMSYFSIGPVQMLHDSAENNCLTLALSSFQMALDILSKNYMANAPHAAAAECYFHIGVIQYELEHYQSASKSHEKSLATRLDEIALSFSRDSISPSERALLSRFSFDTFGKWQKSLPEISSEISISQTQIGDCLAFVEENYHGALESYKQALSRRRKIFSGKPNKEIEESCRNVAMMYRFLGNGELADKFDKEALEIERELSGNYLQAQINSYVKTIRKRSDKRRHLTH